MESDSPAILAGTERGMSKQVAITIKDDHPSSQYYFPHLQFFVYFNNLYVMGLPFMVLLAALRVRIIDKNHPYSPFEIDALFMIICIVAVFVVTLTSLIMIPTYYYKFHYKILTYIGGFSAILAPFSLAMVLYVPPNHFSTRFIPLVCVFLAVVVAFFFLWNYFLSRAKDELEQENKSEEDDGFPNIYFAASLLVPVSLVLVLFTPRNFNLVILSVTLLYCFMVPVYIVGACCLHVISYIIQGNVRGNLK